MTKKTRASGGIDLVSRMQELGFTATEARVYLALVRHSPATGYELARTSDVPRSAIYGVLARLESAGLVNAVQARPAKYVALPADLLTRNLEGRFARTLSELREGLEALTGGREESVTWTLHGYDAMMDEARVLVRGAKASLHASLWTRECAALEDDLATAAARGVDVVLFSFTPLPARFDEALTYGIGEAALEAYWSHKIILVADHERALLGGAEPSESNRAVATDDSALVELALSNVIIDVTLLGQRRGTNVERVVKRLTKRFAPIEELAAIEGARG